MEARGLGNAPVAAEEVKVPWQEVGGFPPSHGIIAKVFFHVRHQLPVHAHPVLGCEAELSALLDLLKDPWLDQRPSACHDGQKAAAVHSLPSLRRQAAITGASTESFTLVTKAVQSISFSCKSKVQSRDIQCARHILWAFRKPFATKCP